MQLNVGVLLVRPNGQVALPHWMVKDTSEPAVALQEFVDRLKQEPLLLKAYTAQAIVSMQDRLEDDEVVPLCKAAGYTLTPIDAHFSDVSKLSHGSLRDYATSILAALAATKVRVRVEVRAS